MSSHTPPSTGTGQPLTETNLRILERLSAASNMSPKRTNTGAQTSAIESTPGSMPAGTKISEDTLKILRSNKLRIDDKAAKRRYPQVVAYASQLVTRKRHSVMDETFQQLALEDRDDNAFTNEATFVHEMWKHMHKDHRDKRISGEPGSDILDEDWTTEVWQLSYLGAKWDRDFRMESLPRLETTDPTAKKLLDAWPRLTNPRPDLTYGIKRRAFTDTELDIGDTYPRFSEVSPGIYFSFFAAEFKGAGGTMGEAEIQACRDGAAMVTAVRELNKIAKPETKDAGADMNSFVFTLTMVPAHAHLYVHWAEIESGKPTVYHMHFLHAYSLQMESTYPLLRRDLNNILDWGLSDRLKELKETLNAIDEQNTSSTNPKRQKTGRQESEIGKGEENSGERNSGEEEGRGVRDRVKDSRGESSKVRVYGVEGVDEGVDVERVYTGM